MDRSFPSLLSFSFFLYPSLSFSSLFFFLSFSLESFFFQTVSPSFGQNGGGVFIGGMERGEVERVRSKGVRWSVDVRRWKWVVGK